MLGWILIDARAYDEAARRFRAAAGRSEPGGSCERAGGARRARQAYALSRPIMAGLRHRGSSTRTHHALLLVGCDTADVACDPLLRCMVARPDS